MNGLFKEIYRGKSLLRTLMNLELKNHSISGKVLDVGGGVGPSYYRFLTKEPNTKVVTLDLEGGTKIDLETDRLPYNDSAIDNILLVNIMEHIYNYDFLLMEIYRVLKGGGKVIGFVPFMINYHPDPHDYFRFSQEALKKIFIQVGFKDINIKAIGRGPMSVNYNNVMIFLPRIMRIIILPFYFIVDKILLKLRPKMNERYPLGYFFELRK